jgi:hypothetical protein
VTTIINSASFFCDRVILKVSEVFCKNMNQYILTRLFNPVTCKNDLYLIYIKKSIPVTGRGGP